MLAKTRASSYLRRTAPLKRRPTYVTDGVVSAVPVRDAGENLRRVLAERRRRKPDVRGCPRQPDHGSERLHLPDLRMLLDHQRLARGHLRMLERLADRSHAATGHVLGLEAADELLNGQALKD